MINLDYNSLKPELRFKINIGKDFSVSMNCFADVSLPMTFEYNEDMGTMKYIEFIISEVYNVYYLIKGKINLL